MIGVTALMSPCDCTVSYDCGSTGPPAMNDTFQSPVTGIVVPSRVNADSLAKIKVQYEVLPPVLDVRDAMLETAPLLDEKRKTKTLMTGALSEKPSNIATYNKFAGGDLALAYLEADVIVEREFTTKMVHQGYIEPHNATANWNTDGTITIWTSTQGAFAVRSLVGLPARPYAPCRGKDHQGDKNPLDRIFHDFIGPVLPHCRTTGADRSIPVLPGD